MIKPELIRPSKAIAKLIKVLYTLREQRARSPANLLMLEAVYPIVSWKNEDYYCQLNKTTQLSCIVYLTIGT
jgi:hypothetical protein